MTSKYFKTHPKWQMKVKYNGAFKKIKEEKEAKSYNYENEYNRNIL